MKHIVAAIALLAASAMPALAQTPPLTPTQDYRMWSAERMISRLVVRLGRLNAACNDIQLQAYLPKISEACEKAVMGAYPRLMTIREIAASGDVVAWANLVDAVRKLEQDTEPLLQTTGK